MQRDRFLGGVGTLSYLLDIKDLHQARGASMQFRSDALDARDIDLPIQIQCC
jgi:hypothetical protein